MGGDIPLQMPTGALASLVLGLAVLSLGFYHIAVVNPRLRAISRTLNGEDHAADADSPALQRSTATSFAKRTDERLAELETIARRDVHRVGFVRYNSFSDVGSDQSFSLALLNAEGDGVVVTSIYSREETRTYGKSVKKFVPQQGASKEEQAAILMARDGSESSR
jgi:hypothetical protein